MPNNCHVLITTQVRNGDVPKDYISNNLYFTTQANASSNDYQALAQHVSDVWHSGTGFGGSSAWQWYTGRASVVKVYDLADPKPRVIRGQVAHTPTTWEAGPLAPRHLALCLSYYALRNLPHSRGRIYLGPWVAGQVAEVPAPTLLASIMDLAHGLFNIATQGAISWAQATHSTVTNQTSTVTNWWANDVWDVQHSRAHSELSRVHYP